MDTDTAFRICERITKAHYENFPVGSWWIPKDKRRYIYSLYAFARAADDFADEPGVHHRLEHLQHWGDLLKACYEGEVQEPVFIALQETIRRFSIPSELLNNLLTAFRMDVTTHRYHKMSEVLSYCQFSANPVGRLVLLLFGYEDPKLHQASDFICTALQLTNFWQDVAIDLEKDRVYIPLEDMASFGYTAEDLKQRAFNEAFRSLLSHEIALTRRLFHQGQPLLGAVGRDLRMELRLVWFGGMRILERIEENRCDVFRHRPKITATDKARLLYRAWRPS